MCNGTTATVAQIQINNLVDTVLATVEAVQSIATSAMFISDVYTVAANCSGNVSFYLADDAPTIGEIISAELDSNLCWN
jgi:hypothetical protein